MIDRKAIFSVIIAICTTILGFIFISQSFYTSFTDEKKSYSYNIEKSADYTVIMKKNKFFEAPIIQQDRTYITDFVDDININFNYKYSIDRRADINYTYRIIGILNVNYAGKDYAQGSLWSKEYELLEPKILDVSNSSEVEINELIKLDYDNFNAQAMLFKEQNNIAVTADLQVKLIVYETSIIDGTQEKVDKQSEIVLKMNLLKDAFLVEENYEKQDSKTVIIPGNSKIDVIYPLIFLGIILIVVSLVIVIKISMKIKKTYIRTEYRIELNRILRRYGEIVAEVVAPIDIESLKVIDVKDFEQMLDVEEELRMPILFYETKPGEQGEFVIIYDSVVYRYTIKG